MCAPRCLQPDTTFLSPIQTYDADATRLNSTQLLSLQASKQRVVCAQQRDVTIPMTSLLCRPLTTVELS